MPTELGPAFSVAYAGVPTHMSSQDYSIWLRWRLTLPADVVALYFDVRLGSGRDAGMDVAAGDAALWFTLTAKRADVVVQLPSEVWLVELRDAAQASAIGRLLLYRRLWGQDPPFPVPLVPVLVTNARDPDVEDEAELHGIRYVVV